MKINVPWACLVCAFFLTSCSWLDSVERKLIGDDDTKSQTSKRPQMVPKAQYDELLARFEEVKRENDTLKESKAPNPLVNDLQNTPVLTNSGVKDAAQGETVDVFAGHNSAAVAEAMTPPGGARPNLAASGANTSAVDSGDVESQLMNYRQALSLQEQNKGEAMKLFSSLARGASPAIKVRAQLHMGEILMQQGEFDLAMQAFDEIISRQAHSGVVLDALRNSVVCADKLGLKQKSEQYRSLLRDVFQVGT